VTAPPPISNTSNFVFTPPPGTTLECSLDGAAWAQCPADYDPTTLSDGSHTLSVKSVNSAGTSSTTQTIGWVLDTTPPAPPTVTGGPVGITQVSTGTFTWAPTPPGDVTQCQLDDGRWHTCTSGISFIDLPAGQHTLSLRVVDAAGNVSKVVTDTFTVAPSKASLAPTASAAFACTSAQVVLINVYRQGHRVYISGAARSAWIGKTVSIKFMVGKATVGHAKISHQGTFALTVPLPAAKLAASNSARYEAIVGRSMSPALKLDRRLTMTTAKQSGKSVLLAGRVTGSFRAGTKVALRLRVTCSSYRTLASVRLTRAGTFTAKVPAPATAAVVGQVAVYRAQTFVLLHGHSFGTYTLPTTATR